MKDVEAKYEEWWEVTKEYFTKDLEKNMAQHKVDERIMRYKLEAYQKKISRFHLWQSNKYRGIEPR
jgi:hypothetical protein